MYAVRRWSVRHARGLEIFYAGFERVMVALHPLWKAIGYERLEKPVAAVEQVVKGFLFDCQMCGQCALSSTGMSCSMNCPKTIRNGPCGGVRANGHLRGQTRDALRLGRRHLPAASACARAGMRSRSCNSRSMPASKASRRG